MTIFNIHPLPNAKPSTSFLCGGLELTLFESEIESREPKRIYRETIIYENLKLNNSFTRKIFMNEYAILMGHMFF
jgi:hypothetical protein